jgi:histidyl-tRNA synthetase
MENLSTLTGKYGEEGDQLLFKILNSGDYLKDVDPYKLNAKDSKQITNSISEKGLRYDLTVPFARYVVMNRNEITFPFKRYQIQPVWRADRPQKGRYREFYQCDADVVGTNSLICEAEIILMIKEVFKGLGISDYTIKVNHRGILSGLAELCEAKGNESSLFVAIDKLDKIGEEKVKEELRERSFTEASLSSLFEILNFKGSTSEKIDFLGKKFEGIEIGKKGISDFKEVLHLLEKYGSSEKNIEFDIALARGLSYYTGCIFEVKINNVSIGSVSGGGRYDNLTGVFGLPGVSGVGFSFGVDRLYDAMEELKLFPQKAQISTQVLITHFDEESKFYGLKVLQTLRDNGIASEIYPDSVKIQKQLDFANKKMIPFTLVIGSEEVKSGMLTLKNMKAGEQTKKQLSEIVSSIKTN